MLPLNISCQPSRFNHDTDLFRIIMCHIVKRRTHSLMLLSDRLPVFHRGIVKLRVIAAGP